MKLHKRLSYQTLNIVYDGRRQTNMAYTRILK
jgi:hypothetical protein